MTSDLDFGPGGSFDAGRSTDLKPCPFRGCDELISVKVRGCSAHKKILESKQARRRQEHPRTKIYADARWKRCRRIVVERDGFTCVDCGFFNPTGRGLVADHFNAGGVMAAEDPFDPDICITRCLICSGKKDGRRGGTRSG